MVAGLASLSYAGHVCGHSGQLWSYLVLVVLVLCFVCLLLFLHNAYVLFLWAFFRSLSFSCCYSGLLFPILTT